MDESIRADLEANYGLRCGGAVPLRGGWLNRLWRFDSGGQSWIIKQYSAERYSPEKFIRLEAALQRQAALEQAGIPCPKILLCGGKAIRSTADGKKYSVMSRCPGENRPEGPLPTALMRDVGSVCAQIHRQFSNLSCADAENHPIDGASLVNALRTDFLSRRKELSPEMPLPFREAVLGQEPILRELDADFFDRLPKGIAHEDFTPDNLLFGPDGLTAVLDFDRNCRGFLWHDVGRALMSFAWDGETLRGGLVRDFLQGYSGFRRLTPEDAADALRVTCCLEIPWWIRPESFAMAPCKASRYRDETVWLIAHWFELGDLLQN